MKASFFTTRSIKIIHTTEIKYMSQQDNKRYFWLKLKDDFFNTEDIKIILSQQNGERYVVFWQKLLLKAITSNEVGVLRYKESIPYTPEMLSSILDTDIDTVRSSLSLFTNMGMISVLEDGAFWVEEATKMVGSETKGAIRKRAIRAKNKQNLLIECQKSGTLSQKRPPEIEKEIELDKKNIKKKTDKITEKKKALNHENLLFTDKEKQALYASYKAHELTTILDKLSEYKYTSGKKYKSDYGTIRLWVAKSCGLHNPISMSKLKDKGDSNE